MMLILTLVQRLSGLRVLYHFDSSITPLLLFLFTPTPPTHTQYFFLPMLLSRSILACVLSNTLYALATVWYAYITHLGYRGAFMALSACIDLMFGLSSLARCGT